MTVAVWVAYGAGVINGVLVTLAVLVFAAGVVVSVRHVRGHYAAEVGTLRRHRAGLRQQIREDLADLAARVRAWRSA